MAHLQTDYSTNYLPEPLTTFACWPPELAGAANCAPVSRRACAPPRAHDGAWAPTPEHSMSHPCMYAGKQPGGAARWAVACALGISVAMASLFPDAEQGSAPDRFFRAVTAGGASKSSRHPQGPIVPLHEWNIASLATSGIWLVALVDPGNPSTQDLDTEVIPASGAGARCGWRLVGAPPIAVKGPSRKISPPPTLFCSWASCRGCWRREREAAPPHTWGGSAPCALLG